MYELIGHKVIVKPNKELEKHRWYKLGVVMTVISHDKDGLVRVKENPLGWREEWLIDEQRFRIEQKSW